MKSLHVIPSVSPVRGGPTYAVLNTVRALRNCGVDAQIITTNDHGPEQVLDVPLGQTIEYEGVPTRFFPCFAPKIGKLRFTTDRNFLFSPDLTRWLWQYLRKYNLVETRYLFSYPPTCARMIACQQKVPYIVHPTGQLASWALAQSHLKKRFYSHLVERRHLQNAAAIQCSSTGEVEDVRNFGITAPTFVVPVGVHPPNHIENAQQKLRNTYGIANQTPIVLFFSRIHYKKRPELLIQALGQLATQNLDVHLLVAGSGEANYLAELKQLVSSLELSKQVSFVGFVEGAKKDLILQGSDLFVLPSFSENFGIAVVEAIAAGLPVVLTPGVQISDEVAKAQAGLVVEGKVESLSDAIAQLLTSPNLRTQMGNNGKQLVRQRYCWNVIAQQLIEHYSTIVRKYR